MNLLPDYDHITGNGRHSVHHRIDDIVIGCHREFSTIGSPTIPFFSLRIAIGLIDHTSPAVVDEYLGLGVAVQSVYDPLVIQSIAVGRKYIGHPDRQVNGNKHRTGISTPDGSSSHQLVSGWDWWTD